MTPIRVLRYLQHNFHSAAPVRFTGQQHEEYFQRHRAVYDAILILESRMYLSDFDEPTPIRLAPNYRIIRSNQ